MTHAALSALPADLVGRFLYKLSQWTAYIGIGFLLLIALGSGLIVIMRGLGSNFAGDFELIEQACFAAIFCFFPWAQFDRSHAAIDLIMRHFPVFLQRCFEAIAQLGLALLGALLVWRLGLGAQELHQYGQQTMILGFPVWLSFAPALWGLALTVPVGLYLAFKACLNIGGAQDG